MSSALHVSAFKSPKKEALYLYIPKDTSLESLPNELLVMFGKPEHVIDFEMSPERKMPRINPVEALKAISKKGYFMQMPPTEAEKMGNMPPPPEHLDNIF